MHADDAPAHDPTAHDPLAHDARTGGLDLVHLAVAEADLAAVEHALARLDAGTWGTCERCGVALDPVALQDHPMTLACAEHR